MSKARQAQVIVVGAGLAGLSAAIYLGRAQRDVLVVHDGKSMAQWEPDVENYLGFPRGIHGEKLLEAGRLQARKHGIAFARDKIISCRRIKQGEFRLRGQRGTYRCNRLLLATGIFHIPPDIPGVSPCLGHSLFFCKDCDGYRVKGKRVAIYGWTNETAEYALAMLLYSPSVSIVTDSRKPRWDRRHALLLKEKNIPVCTQCIVRADHRKRQLRAMHFADGTRLPIRALFTTRGDIYFNKLAKELGAVLDEEGQIKVDHCMQTSVKGVYAAGCVTPANCQMIIAAGQGATAAQAINRDLFLRTLETHTLKRLPPGGKDRFRRKAG